jgi:hypothetical protein
MNKKLTNLWNLSKNQPQSAPESPNVAEGGFQENENLETAASVPTADQEVKMKRRSKSSTGGNHKRVRSMQNRSMTILWEFATLKN